MSLSAVAGISVYEGAGSTTISKTIPAFSTVEIERINRASLYRSRYDIYLRTGNGYVQSFSVPVLNSGFDIHYSISEILGDDITYDFSFTIDGSDVIFTFSSGTNYSIDFKAKRYNIN